MEELAGALHEAHGTYHFAGGEFADEADAAEDALAVGLTQVLLVAKVGRGEVEVSSRSCSLEHVLTSA